MPCFISSSTVFGSSRVLFATRFSRVRVLYVDGELPGELLQRRLGTIKRYVEEEPQRHAALVDL